jgi:glycosyltransferase involved in cell wall biosynthesis
VSAALTGHGALFRAPPRLVIVLSAYNGAQHIGAQIESIQAQSVTDWGLLVRDDGSADDTVGIVERFACLDDRVRLCRDGRGNLGSAASFGVLLEYAWECGADFVALADQDDVWVPDKLERQLAVLVEHQAQFGPGHPALVHSDLAVVDKDLRPLHPSFLRRQRLEHVASNPMSRLLAQNFVTGCTIVLNRSLLGAAVPLPRVVMHDWWLAQCAAAFGTLLFLPDATVQYRQHSANVVGSRGVLRLYVDALRRPLSWWVKGRRNLAAAVDQSCELAARLEALGIQGSANPAGDLVVDYCEALRSPTGRFQRLHSVRRLGVRPQSLFYPGYYLRVLAGLPDRRSGDA